MRALIFFLAIFGWAQIIFGQTQTLGRYQLVWPDFQYPGGQPQVDLIHAAVEKLSDAALGRFFEQTINDTVTATITHDFQTDFGNLKVLLFDGQGITKTLITTDTTPALSDFTIAANGTNPRTQIDVTNNSGGNEALTILIVDTGETFDTAGVLQNLTIFDQGELRLNEDSGSGSNYAGFKSAATLAGNLIWSLPDVDGSTGQVLKTDGSLALGWATALTDPMTTRGDIIIRNTSNVTDRLAVGAASTVLTSDGTDPSWTTVSSAMITNDTIVDADINSAAAISGSKLQAASASNAGAVTTGTQTIAGDKTLTGDTVVGGDAGLNTLDVSSTDDDARITIDGGSGTNDDVDIVFSHSGTTFGRISTRFQNDDLQFLAGSGKVMSHISASGSETLRINTTTEAEILVPADNACGIGNVCSGDGITLGTDLAESTNLDSLSTTATAVYFRIGNGVDLGFHLQATPTTDSAGNLTRAIMVGVPHGSSDTTQVHGNCVASQGDASAPASILGWDIAEDEIRVEFDPNGSGTYDFECTVMYKSD